MWKIGKKKPSQIKYQKKLYFLTLVCSFSHRTNLFSLHSSRDEKNSSTVGTMTLQLYILYNERLCSALLSCSTALGCGRR